MEWVTHAENIAYSYKAGRYPKLFGKENPNYGNKKLSQFYSRNPDVAKEKQSRPNAQNGHARKVDLYYNNKFVKRFDCYKLCCEYLMKIFKLKSTSYISNVMNKIYKNGGNYKGYSIIKY